MFKGCRGFVCLVFSVLWCGASFAGDALPAPAGATASIQSDPSGIFLSWEAVAGAASYQIRVFPSLVAETAEGSISTSNSGFLDMRPCGVSRYYEVRAEGPSGNSEYTPRFFGQSMDCPYATQDCTSIQVPLPGMGTYTGTTVNAYNSYQIANRVGPCEDGNEPGTAGTGRDVVYSYRSPVDCTLTVTLLPEISFNSILYVSDTCEVNACNYFDNIFTAGPEVITFPVTADQTYYIFVDGYNAESAGSYTLTLSSADCVSAPACNVLEEGFAEGGLPVGWSTINLDSIPNENAGRHAPRTWGVIEDLSGPLYNRVVAAYADPTINANNEEWLISGPIAIGEDAVLRWRDLGIGEGGTQLVLAYAAREPNPSAFVALGNLLSLSGGDIGPEYTQREVSLAAKGLANETIYIGFLHFARQSGYYFLDDIGICDVPGTVEGEIEGEGEGEPLCTYTANIVGCMGCDIWVDGSFSLASGSSFTDVCGSSHCYTASTDSNAMYVFTSWDGLGVSEASVCTDQLTVTALYDPVINEGEVEGEGAGEGEGAAEGEGERLVHTGDQNGDGVINLSELLRVIQFYNSTGYGCQAGTEDGFAPSDPDQNCTPHASDYAPQNWLISLSELLRLIQFYNIGGYSPCPQGEDGFCPGA